MGKDGRTMATRSEAEELLRTLFADPEGARRVAEQQLVTDPDPAVGSVGHQIVGIVLRDLGETADALHHLDRALTLARAVDDVRESDVRATLGGTLVHAGRTREGLAHLDSAAEKAHGLALATVLVRRARVLVFNLERLPEGVEDLRRALEILDATDDPIWRARALHLEGLSLLRLGDVPAAKGSFARTSRSASTPWAGSPSSRVTCREPSRCMPTPVGGSTS
jgi:tetratricopeptide (TPR) repeat protein